MSRIEKLKEMLVQTPSDCFLLHALGLEHVKIGDVEQAVIFFEKVIQTDHNYVGTYYHLAKAYEHLQQSEKAIATYEKGIEIATRLRDMHARNELQMALDEWI